MKHGVRPTKKQCQLIESKGLNHSNWLITKDTPTELHLVHRHFDNKTKIIPKGVREDGRG